MRKKDRFWEHGEELKGRFIYKYCEKDFPGRISRLKSHLSRQAGRDVAICEKVPDDVQAEALLAIGGGNQSNKRGREILSTENASVNPTERPSKLSQSTITEMCNLKNKEVVDDKVADFFFINNIPFNVIQTDAFIDMLKAVGSYGVGYASPSYTTLRTKLLMRRREHVKRHVEEVKKSWELSGCTIVSDIWTCMKSRAFINVVACCPKGDVFLKSFERSLPKKTGELLKELIISVIDEIGAHNVVQVITDNASNYGCAGQMIIDKYPHIYKTKCGAHGIQLVVRLLVNVTGVPSMLPKRKKDQDYFQRHWMTWCTLE